MPHQQKVNPEMQDCIETCLDCFKTCQQTALQHCLPMGGKHVEQEHFRLMFDCAEICRSAATLMINGSPFHHQLCGVCAEICRACAESCKAIEEMEDCAKVCEQCADSCERMAGMGDAGQGGQGRGAEQHAH